MRETEFVFQLITLTSDFSSIDGRISRADDMSSLLSEYDEMRPVPVVSESSARDTSRCPVSAHDPNGYTIDGGNKIDTMVLQTRLVRRNRIQKFLQRRSI